jgi:hypothetical protein
VVGWHGRGVDRRRMELCAIWFLHVEAQGVSDRAKAVPQAVPSCTNFERHKVLLHAIIEDARREAR